MSTSACGEGGPNGAVGGLGDTSVPGAGECGAGKAYCKRYRRLAANGDFTGLAFVGEDKERPMKTVLAYIERKGFSDKPVAIAVKLSSQGSCTGCHVKCCDGYNGTEWEVGGQEEGGQAQHTSTGIGISEGGSRARLLRALYKRWAQEVRGWGQRWKSEGCPQVLEQAQSGPGECS